MLNRHEIKVHVDQHLLVARATMLPRVQNAFDRLLQERSLLTSDPAPYFSPLGHPLFELPVWVASRLDDEGIETPSEVLSNVLGVSALGYLHARAQDDWLDGCAADDPTLIAVAEALIALCNQLLASVGASTRFWRYYSQILNEYAESLLDVAEVRRTKAPISRSTFERLLAQSRPLVLPSAALLDRADSWHLRDHLEEFVLTATASSQLFNDLADLYRDRDMGHRTWTTDTVGESAADELWREVAGEASSEQQAGRISERIRTALSFHERSARAARALGLTAAGTWLTDRQAAMEGLLGSLRENLLATFVSRMAESGQLDPIRREHGKAKEGAHHGDVRRLPGRHSE